VSLAWTEVIAFPNGVTPDDGDFVRILRGQSFQDQAILYDGLIFTCNPYIRLFNGSDYWEMSALYTSTLLDNTTGNVFSLSYLGSEHLIVDYSLDRGTHHETGTIHITTDGTNVQVTSTGAYIGASGIIFTGDILGSDLRLRFTSDLQTQDATMKYIIKRWSSGAGGPGGPPTYTSGSSPIAAAGASGSIQYNNGGLLAGDGDFTWDAVNNILSLGTQKLENLKSVTLNDNISTPTMAFFYNATAYRYAIIEYSIERSFDARVGRLLVVNSSLGVSMSDDFTDIGDTGILFTAGISFPNVIIQYVSTMTGFNGTMKYTIKGWN
jgi:hypothetical protein